MKIWGGEWGINEQKEFFFVPVSVKNYHSGRWTENNKKILGEHKMITPKQQCLGVILCFLCI